VGHEYPSLRAWRESADALGCDVATFQHSPVFCHDEDAFDGIGHRLYCYSQQMANRYHTHSPILELAVHAGWKEREPDSVKGEGLVWVGRVDEDKSPRLAVRAAQILGRRIRVVGPVFDGEVFVYTYSRDYSEKTGRNPAIPIVTEKRYNWEAEPGAAEETPSQEKSPHDRPRPLRRAGVRGLVKVDESAHFGDR
jgi:hypothetical protein